MGFLIYCEQMPDQILKGVHNIFGVIPTRLSQVSVNLLGVTSVIV